MMAIGAQDPVLGLDTMRKLHQHIRACTEPVVLEHAGHFVPEHGREVARQALSLFGA